MLVLRAAIVLILAGGATSAMAEQITCESHRIGGAEPCGTVAAGSTVTLARQLSGPACVEGKTWGTGPDHDSIWVSGGCRGVFDVRPPYSGAATGSEERDRYDDRNDSGDVRNSYHADAPTDRNDMDEPYADAPAPREDDRNSPPRRDDDERYAGTPPRDDDRYAQDRDADERDAAVDRDRDGDVQSYRNDDRIRDREPRRYARSASGDSARQACIDQAAVGQRFGPDQIEAGDARRIGNGLYSVDLDTPTGQVECTVDADGRVRSLDRDR